MLNYDLFCILIQTSYAKVASFTLNNQISVNN